MARRCSPRLPSRATVSSSCANMLTQQQAAWLCAHSSPAHGATCLQWRRLASPTRSTPVMRSSWWVAWRMARGLLSSHGWAADACMHVVPAAASTHKLQAFQGCCCCCCSLSTGRREQVGGRGGSAGEGGGVMGAADVPAGQRRGAAQHGELAARPRHVAAGRESRCCCLSPAAACVVQARTGDKAAVEQQLGLIEQQLKAGGSFLVRSNMLCLTACACVMHAVSSGSRRFTAPLRLR